MTPLRALRARIPRPGPRRSWVVSRSAPPSRRLRPCPARQGRGATCRPAESVTGTDVRQGGRDTSELARAPNARPRRTRSRGGCDRLVVAPGRDGAEREGVRRDRVARPASGGRSRVPGVRASTREGMGGRDPDEHPGSRRTSRRVQGEDRETARKVCRFGDRPGRRRRRQPCGAGSEPRRLLSDELTPRTQAPRGQYQSAERLPLRTRSSRNRQTGTCGLQRHRASLERTVSRRLTGPAGRGRVESDPELVRTTRTVRHQEE